LLRVLGLQADYVVLISLRSLVPRALVGNFWEITGLASSQHVVSLLEFRLRVCPE